METQGANGSMHRTAKVVWVAVVREGFLEEDWAR